LYPDHHGIINNVFYDPKIKEVFSLGSNAKTDGFFMVETPFGMLQQQGVRTAAFTSDTGKP
jgi:alkaline phosphatase D